MATSPTGNNIKRLREARGLSQRGLSDQTGIPQPTISRMEKTHPGRLPHDALAALAKALGVEPDALVASTAPGEAGAEASWRVVREPVDPRAPEEDETPLESALFEVFDSKRDRVPAFDASRRVIRETWRYTREDADLPAQARAYLDAAGLLLREGRPLTTPAILAYVINGSRPGAQEMAKERAASINAAADEALRAKGAEPGQGADAFKALVRKPRAKGG